MNFLMLFLMSTMTMLSFLMLIQTRMINLIKLLILQNILLACYLLDRTWIAPSFDLYLSLAATLIIKVIMFPWVLWKLTHYLQLQSHRETVINKPTVQLIGILLVIFSLLFSHQIEFSIGQKTIMGLSFSLANTLLALLLIICRRKAIAQIIGLLMMENSIFLLSMTLTAGFPWLIELGMGFDILIGFMIFGLFLLRIYMTHGSWHLQHLEKLKERS